MSPKKFPPKVYIVVDSSHELLQISTDLLNKGFSWKGSGEFTPQYYSHYKQIILCIRIDSGFITGSSAQRTVKTKYEQVKTTDEMISYWVAYELQRTR